MILDWLRREWDRFMAGQPPKSEPPRKRTAGFGGMRFGERYEVVRAFTDFDGDEHPVGESWIFTGDNFLPYEDGQSLFVEMEPGVRHQIRMQWRPEAQGEILDNWGRYVRRAETSS